MTNIYPLVVPAAYFELPAEARGFAGAGLDAFGIVRPLGNGLYSMLMQDHGDTLANLHDDDLAALGLDRAAAERAALSNLSALVASPGSIQRQVNKTPSGFHFAVWFGDRFTSSCILWPGLYEWARRELETDQLIVMAPHVQLMCVAARGDPEFRSAIRTYMEQVVATMDKQLSTAWFSLTPAGISPLDTD